MISYKYQVDTTQKPMFDIFSKTEKKNLFLYALGIFIWKWGLECINACVSGMVLRRYGYDVTTKKASPDAGVIWTTMLSINLTCQVFGVLLVGPLFKRFRPTYVLTSAVIAWGAIVAIIPILEIATGGKPPLVAKGSSNPANWGSWNPLILYGIFSLIGLCSGIVEIIRRIIPGEIMGLNTEKLKLMDSSVHMANEISGTFGSMFASWYIGFFGWGYAPLLVPVTFLLASLCFYKVEPTEKQVKYETDLLANTDTRSLGEEAKDIFTGVVYSITWGAKLIFSHRNLIWLLPCYSVGLIIHKYVEGTIFPFYANEILKNSDYQTILTAGSNFGEFLGAVLVIFTARSIPTPIPYVRLDAISLFIGWVFYYYRPGGDLGGFAWSYFPLMTLLSLGWSAGDVSLAAHIQGNLGKHENANKHCTPLHAVFSFLYIFNLIVYFVVNVFMGRIRDEYKRNGYDMYNLFFWIAGVVLSVSAVVIFLGSMIPTGSLALNPKNEEQLIETDAFEESEKNASSRADKN
jgi:hypothetical protein